MLAIQSPEDNRCIFKWCRYTHICSRCRRGKTQPLIAHREISRRAAPHLPSQRREFSQPETLTK